MTQARLDGNGNERHQPRTKAAAAGFTRSRAFTGEGPRKNPIIFCLFPFTVMIGVIVYLLKIAQGCRTCRNRHLKCDETRPACKICIARGSECEGYEARLFWLPDQHSAHTAEESQSQRSTSYRFPIFTEEARTSMSLALVQSIGDRSAGDVVLDLDAEEPSDFVSRVVGPFGVFRASQAPSMSPASEDPPSSSTTPTPPPRPLDLPLPSTLSGTSYPLGEHPARTHLVPSENTLPSIPIQSIPDLDPLSHLDYLGLSHLHSQQQGYWVGAGAGGFSQLSSVDDPSLDLLSPPRSLQMPCQVAVNDLTEYHQPNEERNGLSGISRSGTGKQISVPDTVASPASHLSPGMPLSNLPVHAHDLLRYYREKIDEPSSSIDRRISPWQLLLLPCALQAFAELTLWNHTSHARCTILFSLLASSAFHLHNSRRTDSDADHWLNVALDHQRYAKKHLKNALQNEWSATGQTSYNEVLMAVLAKAMLAFFRGSRTVRVFLLDAERLIRSYGLSRTRSFNDRLLHHLYTHLRVFAESFVSSVQLPHETQPHLKDIRPIVEISKFDISDEFLENEFDPSQTKPDEVGYNDIHLDVPGLWHATLYQDIFGIPESLMTLLSRTIRLVNKKAKLESTTLGNTKLSSTILSRHIKSLERNIWLWPYPTSLIEESNPKNMALAMHQALIVYFYRRAYNVSAMVVQSFVAKALEHLHPCLEITLKSQDFATTVAWAGFIASCEAATPELQEHSLQCLKLIDESGILFGAQKPSEFARSVWTKREQAHDWTLSWSELMRFTT
ncbi:hypothetical protein F4803DRAFT_573941 [Xylaria telfairii]|nr:hypothetical protein F4803DRAFT_573941 [Xylaria telfairii]